MREYKFRAWDKDEKFMAYELNKIHFHLPFYVEYWRTRIKKWVGKEPKHCLEGNANIILMQYINRKDKNNKEIYEEDIVIDNVGRIWVVRFSKLESSFNFYWNGGIQNQPFSRFIKVQKPLEVIGNTIENPELMETK